MALLFVAGCAGEVGFEGYIRFETEVAGRGPSLLAVAQTVPKAAHYYFQAGNVRIRTEGGLLSHLLRDVVYLADGAEVYYLDSTAQKAYELILPDSAPAQTAPVPLARTGEGRKIQGYWCNHYAGERGNEKGYARYEVWAAPALKTPVLAAAPAAQMGSRAAMAQVEGFPLRWQMTFVAGPDSIVRVERAVRVQATDAPPLRPEVPEDYAREAVRLEWLLARQLQAPPRR